MECEVIVVAVAVLLIVRQSFLIHRAVLIVGTNVNECCAILNGVAIRHRTSVTVSSQNFTLTICSCAIRQNHLGVPQSRQVGVVVGYAQTDIITEAVPLSVKEFLCQIQGLLCQCIAAVARLLALVSSLASIDVAGNALCLCIVDQSICQRRYASQVAVAIANDGAGQLAVLLVSTSPGLRLTAPDQAGRNGEGSTIIGYTLGQIRNCEGAHGSVIRLIVSIKSLGSISLTQNSVVHEPAYPAIQNLFQSCGHAHAANLYAAVAVFLDNIVQFCQTLNCPYLVTNPVVGTRVSIYRVFQICHVVESRLTSRICLILTAPGVGAAAGDRTVAGQQPQIQFHLSFQRSLVVVSSAGSLHASIQLRIIYQSVCSQRVLIEFVAVRCADLPCPRAV